MRMLYGGLIMYKLYHNCIIMCGRLRQPYKKDSKYGTAYTL